MNLVKLGDILTEGDHQMASAVGGIAGVTPLGDRPGTTTAMSVGSWSGTPAGRARLFAAGFFVTLVFFHVAAANRFQA